MLLSKSSSQLVVDVMTSNPLTATPTMSLNEATRYAGSYTVRILRGMLWVDGVCGVLVVKYVVCCYRMHVIIMCVI